MILWSCTYTTLLLYISVSYGVIGLNDQRPLIKLWKPIHQSYLIHLTHDQDSYNLVHRMMWILWFWMLNSNMHVLNSQNIVLNAVTTRIYTTDFSKFVYLLLLLIKKNRFKNRKCWIALKLFPWWRQLLIDDDEYRVFKTCWKYDYPCEVEFIISRTFMNCSWSFMKYSWLVHDWFMMMVHEHIDV
jgi:hypothetical protein